MATSDYFASTRPTPLTEEEVQKWRSIPREEWKRFWYEEYVPADQRPEWPNNVRKIEADKFPCHGEWMTVPARDGYEIPVLVYKPKHEGKTALYFQIHGGGFATGHPLTNDYECTLYNQELDILVVSIGYRLAPECEYPCCLNDCYDVIKWFHDHAAEWNIDTDHMGVGGCSSGGHLTVGTCMLAAQRKEFKLRYQMLLYPGMDNYGIPDTTDDAIEVNTMYINLYSDVEATKNDPLVNPLTASDELLQQLPPALVLTAGADWLKGPADDFANRLMQNGVPVTYWCVAGAVHAFTIHFPGCWDEERAPKAQQFMLDCFRQYLL